MVRFKRLPSKSFPKVPHTRQTVISGNSVTRSQGRTRTVAGADGEVYHHIRRSNRQPRFESRGDLPRRLPCAKPPTMIKGKPAVRWTAPSICISGHSKYKDG